MIKGILLPNFWNINECSCEGRDCISVCFFGPVLNENIKSLHPGESSCVTMISIRFHQSLDPSLKSSSLRLPTNHLLQRIHLPSVLGFILYTFCADCSFAFRHHDSVHHEQTNVRRSKDKFPEFAIITVELWLVLNLFFPCPLLLCCVSEYLVV